MATTKKAPRKAPTRKSKTRASTAAKPPSPGPEPEAPGAKVAQEPPERILTNDEVDSLLAGMKSPGTEPGDAEKPQPQVVPYDLSQHAGMYSAVRLPGLDLLNEHFARSFRVALFNLLRCSVDVRADPYRATTFGDFMNKLPTPTSMNIVNARPLYGPSMFVLDAHLVHTLVDIYFGGSGKSPSRTLERDFTPTETRVVRTFLQHAFSDLHNVWKSVVELSFKYERTEQNPRFASIYGPDEVVIESSFTVDLEGNPSKFTILLTAAMLEPVKEGLTTGYQDSSANQEEDGVALAYLEGVPTEVVAEIGSATMSIKRLLSLRPGEVIPLEGEMTATLKAEHLTIGRGKPGVRAGNYGVMLDQVESLSELSGKAGNGGQEVQ